MYKMSPSSLWAQPACHLTLHPAPRVRSLCQVRWHQCSWALESSLYSLVDQGGWHRVAVQADWPALAPASCVTMGKSLGLSVPYFPTYKIGMMVRLAPIQQSCKALVS